MPFRDEQFDVAVCTQVYEYVEDIAAALAEARRVLRPGGRLLVLDTDWDSIVWHSCDRERMERVLAAWNEHLADPYLPRRLPALMRAAGLELASRAIIPILNVRRGPQHVQRRHASGSWPRSSPAAAASPRLRPRPGQQDLESLGDDYFFSLNRYLFVAKRKLISSWAPRSQ